MLRHPALNKTYTYEYDDAGNMLYKRQCAFTLAETLPTMSTIFDMTHETYNGWGDQMDMNNINYYDFTKAPIGYDGYRIELHHVKGINNSPEIIPMSKASHAILHKYVGYRNMLDYVIRR